MKLSTKGRYGLRVMFDLALNGGDAPVSLAEISARQEISLSYLEQLMILLRKAGLVNSVRGASGGYALSRSPEEITVGEILIALEGSLAPTQCTVEKNNDCVQRLVYTKIYEGILDVVNHLTLQDMKREFYSAYWVDKIINLKPMESSK